jgi:diguanylate cyclase (GGDEF)-like protein
MNMSRDPIKITIGLGFAGVLVLMGLISFTSLSQMKDVTDQASALLKETNAKISAASTMRDSIRLRGDTLYKMYLTDDFIERDELRLRLSGYGLKYKESHDVLYNYRMTAREAKLLDQLIQQTREAKALNDHAAESLLSNLPEETIKTNLIAANVARHNMLIGLNELMVLQENIAEEIIEEEKSLQETTGNIILLLSLSAFFIAIFIAHLVIRETSKKNSEIRFQATHDELTKLVNRIEFNRRFKEAHSTAIYNFENHALCFLDLDKFKVINDTCGHKAGDELLIQLTHLIKRNIRNHDTFARIGGDEFALLLEGCSQEKAIEIAEGIVSLVKTYEFNWQNRKFHVGVSIGIVAINEDTQSIEKALSQADDACYTAKNLGRNQVHVYGMKVGHSSHLHDELRWVADINDESQDSHFSLYLQKIVNLQSENSSPMYEVLLRINDDENTLVTPGNYISTAERFSLMKDVDYWVIEKTFAHLAHLHKEIIDCDIRFFINISANSLTNNRFSDHVIELIRKYKITPDTVCLEISEYKAVKNINQTAEIVNTLRRHNIKFALDDFGSGVPSFSYLKNLPVDYLKINGNIIKNMSHSTADKAMIAAINQIGEVMNINIIAKHVENVFTLNQLKEIGITYAQGFYIDKPTDIDSRLHEIKDLSRKQNSHY